MYKYERNDLQYQHFIEYHKISIFFKGAYKTK